MEKKTCTKCKTSKTTLDFYSDKGKPDGLSLICKECANENARRYNEKNADEVKANSRKYYLEHRDEIIARAKQYRIDNLDKINAQKKVYRERTKEQKRATDREYYRAHKEEARVYNKQYRVDNKEKLKRQQAISYQNNRKERLAKSKIYNDGRKAENCARARRWAKDNPARARAQGAKRRALRYSQTPPNADMDKITAIYDECRRLSEETGIQHHVDHIIPLVEGGLHHQDNLQILTAEENLRKGAKLPAGAQYTLRLKRKEVNDGLS